jgi:hypothetical protein
VWNDFEPLCALNVLIRSWQMYKANLDDREFWEMRWEDKNTQRKMWSLLFSKAWINMVNWYQCDTTGYRVNWRHNKKLMGRRMQQKNASNLLQWVSSIVANLLSLLPFFLFSDVVQCGVRHSLAVLHKTTLKVEGLRCRFLLSVKIHLFYSQMLGGI